MPHRLYEQVAARASYRCEYCQAPEAVSPDQFQVEHIRPRARGGLDEFGNLALACPPCNRHKAEATHAIDPLTETVVALFSPRQDIWEEHFRIDRPQSAFIVVGLTPTGRATVQRLAMNAPHVVRARSWWFIARLFPP